MGLSGTNDTNKERGATQVTGDTPNLGVGGKKVTK